MMKQEFKRIKYNTIQRENCYIEDIVVSGDIVVPVIKYEIFAGFNELIHGFSTREGGVSKEHLFSMNLSYSRGDDRDNVNENHRRFGEALGYDCNKLVFSDQVHDIKIHTVTEEDAGKGIVRESDLKGIDGLVTDCRNIPLITFYADCVPLYFFDPIRHVIALAHSGWRGTVGKIGTVMVDRMAEEFGCDRSDIICAIGPSICKDCYEVSEDVANVFKSAYSPERCNSLLYDKGNGKYQLDLHKSCRYNLIDAGILPQNIAMPDFCTCCNSELLFSHRASNGMRGNLVAVMMLRQE